MNVRDRILAEATSLFARQGYQGTSVREIVAAAGVTKPTLYYYFGSKEGLFRTLVTEKIARSQKELEALLDQPGTVRERLTRLLQQRRDEIAAQPDLVQLIADVAMAGHRSEPAFDFTPFFAREGQLTAQLLEQGMASGELRRDDPMELAIALLGLIHYRIAASVSGGPPLQDASFDVLLNLYFDGVAR